MTQPDFAKILDQTVALELILRQDAAEAAGKKVETLGTQVSALEKELAGTQDVVEQIKLQNKIGYLSANRGREADIANVEATSAKQYLGIAYGAPVSAYAALVKQYSGGKLELAVDSKYAKLTLAKLAEMKKDPGAQETLAKCMQVLNKLGEKQKAELKFRSGIGEVSRPVKKQGS